LWAKRAGGNHLDSGNDIATDALANVYVTGWLASASVIFGTDTLTNTGFSNVFLAKYDSSGHVIWVTRSMGTDRDEGMYVAADSSGNVYLTGTYESPIITFGSYPLFNAGNADAFLAKYDSSGNVRWAKSIGGSALDWGYCVSIANSTKIYITGWFDSTLLNFDSIIVPRPNFGHDPMYFAGYDSSGQVLFAKGLGSGGYNNNAVAASPTGCIYIVGGFQGINPFKLGNDSLVLSGQEDIFVAKLCYSGLTAGFISSSSIFCAAPVQCINFYDDSYGNPTSWHWSFTGATPDTSSLQNPDSICYSIAGSYPVSLIVSNGTLTDTLTVASMIIVGNPPLPPTITVVGGDTLYSSHGLWYQWFLNGMYIFGAYDSFYVALQGGTYSVQITDQYGCQSQSAGIQVGIDELSGGVGVAVYPNPFNDELVASPRSALGGRGEWEFTLFDVTSRVLFHRLFTNQTTINTEQLARGIYFYEVRDKNGAKEMGKVVKE